MNKDPISKNRCTGRRRYPTIELAELAAELARFKGYAGLQPHPCKMCEGYHLGNGKADK